MYTVTWDKSALQDLKTLDKAKAINLVKKVEKHLSQSPQKLGKPLSGQLNGLYRYRFGDYRVIYEVNKQEVMIIVVRVGHRKEVYN